MNGIRLLLFAVFLSLLAGCDQVNQLLGLEDLVKKEERQEADGRAVGGACRQSGRAIEDCYAIYSWLPRAAMYAGWRDMDAYMRENKIETVEPQLPPVEPPGSKKRRSVKEDDEEEKEEKKPAKSAKPAKKSPAAASGEGKPATGEAEGASAATVAPVAGGSGKK